jgi:hypothetical protein
MLGIKMKCYQGYATDSTISDANVDGSRSTPAGMGHSVSEQKWCVLVYYNSVFVDL